MECTRHETIIDKTPCRCSFGPHVIAEWAMRMGAYMYTLITCKETTLGRLFLVPVIRVNITITNYLYCWHLNFNRKVRWINGIDLVDIIILQFMALQNYQYKLQYNVFCWFMFTSKRKWRTMHRIVFWITQIHIDKYLYIVCSKQNHLKCE